MIEYALYFAYGCFGLALLSTVFTGWFSRRDWRIGCLALDTMTVNMIALLTLFGIDHGTTMYFEASLLFAMVGFISTVAYAKFVLRGDIIE